MQRKSASRVGEIEQLAYLNDRAVLRYVRDPSVSLLVDFPVQPSVPCSWQY